MPRPLLTLTPEWTLPADEVERLRRRSAGSQKRWAGMSAEDRAAFYARREEAKARAKALREAQQCQGEKP